jgi:hypothetical protein
MATGTATAVRPIGEIATTTAMAGRVDGTGGRVIAMTVRSVIAVRLRVVGEAGTMTVMDGPVAGRDAQATARAAGKVVRVVPARVAGHRAHVRLAATMATVEAIAAGRAATTTAATTDGGA